MKKIISFIIISILLTGSSLFAGQQALVNCKILEVSIFGANYEADNNHKAGQVQVKIDPHGMTLPCSGDYLTTIADNTSNFELITATLEKALSEKRYVHILVADDNETYQGRCRIVSVTLTNATY